MRRKARLRSKTELARKTPLKRRGVMEAHKDDPDRYGEAWLAVRTLPCFGRLYLPGHECGPGYAPATAHHLGKKDSDGLVPVCGAMHDRLHAAHLTREVEEQLARAGSPTLAQIGATYVNDRSPASSHLSDPF